MSAGHVFLPPKGNVQEFTAPGSFIVPEGIHVVTVHGCGGGQGGGSFIVNPGENQTTSYKGGNGALLGTISIGVSPGASIGVSIGAGGAVSVGVGIGGGGTNSTFGSVTFIGSSELGGGARGGVNLKGDDGAFYFGGSAATFTGGGGAGPFGDGGSGNGSNAGANSGGGGSSTGPGGSGKVIVAW